MLFHTFYTTKLWTSLRIYSEILLLHAIEIYRVYEKNHQKLTFCLLLMPDHYANPTALLYFFAIRSYVKFLGAEKLLLLTILYAPMSLT